jgi:hypothetical protein
MWSLVPEEAETVRTALASLPDAAGIVPPLPDQLGYRGFRLADPDLDQVSTVYGPVIYIQTGNVRLAKLDTARQLEQALVRLARPHLDANLYAFLLSQLGS